MIEIIVVLAILGVLLLLFMPNLYRSTDHWILRSTAVMIANDIRSMQSLSVKECDQYQLELHTRQFYYLTRNFQPTAAPMKTVHLHPSIVEITSTLWNPGLTGSFTGYRILRFSFLGNPNQAGNIILRSKNGRSITITVDVATGRVRIID